MGTWSGAQNFFSWAREPTNSTRVCTPVTVEISLSSREFKLQLSEQKFRKSSMLPQCAQMRGQGFDIAIVLAKHRNELIALGQCKPHAFDGDIDQHRLRAIGANAEIDLHRLACAGHVGVDDIVAGGALARGAHAQ